MLGDRDRRAPHIVCVAVGGVEAEPVLLGLDQGGIAAHSGSSCSSESLAPSPVLDAMGVDAERSLRLSVGWSTTDDDVEAFATAFAEGRGATAGPARPERVATFSRGSRRRSRRGVGPWVDPGAAVPSTAGTG